MKKIISMLLIVCLLGVLASGCGSNKQTVDSIKESGKLIIHTNAGFAPYEFVYENEIVGVDIEIMKKPWYGEKGHIAIACNNIKRAEAYLKSIGVKFIEESKNIDAKGNYKAVYIDGDIAGFAVHLVQK